MDDRLVVAVFIEEGAGLEARLGPEVPEGVHGDPDERYALLVSVVTDVTGFWWREGWAVVSRCYHRQASSFHRRRCPSKSRDLVLHV